MNKFGIAPAVAGTFFSFFSALAVADTDKADVVKVWEIDFVGPPPFKRIVKELPAADVAVLEIAEEAVETEVKWRAKLTGHPPFKRSYQEVEVIDASSLEIVEEESEERSKSRRTKTRFKRHL